MDVNAPIGGNDFDPDECHFVRNKFVDTDYEEISKIIDDLPIFCSNEDNVNLERSFERFTYLIDQYQEQRHLLDAKLSEFISPLLNQVRNCWNGCANAKIHEPMKYLWYLSKVRGPKVFIRRLPHEVDDFEPVLNLLRNNEDCSSPKWEIRYVCLLWLALLCKLPFSFDLLLTASENPSIVRPLFDMGRKILLKYADKSREAACTFLCELISRSDFRYDTKNSIESCLIDLQSEFLALEDQNLEDEQKIISFLMLFCHLFKRLEKKCWNSRFIESLLQALLSKKFESSKDILIRKLNVKLTQRIALVIIQSSFKVDSDWLYRKQAVNLNESLKSNQPVGDGVSKKNDDVVLDTPQNFENLQIDGGDKEQRSSDSVEKIVDYLSKALDDKDTIVRWSAAKGIGRITAKLPKNLADNVVNLILKILEQNEKDSAVHGACLSLAELGRRGCLLPARLPQIVGAVSKALTYEQLRATYSIGGHVRDAACYVCWSLARAFKKGDLEPHIRQLTGRLITTALFDFGVTCRRAASAALQEIVGRLPNVVGCGLDLIRALDYAAVGNRAKCFRQLSVEVSLLDADYSTFIFQHVINFKLSHFDQEIRSLAADCLGNSMQYKSKQEIIQILHLLEQNCYSKNSFLRNGSLLAIAKILPSIDQSKIDDIFFVQSIPIKLVEQKLLAGIGADVTKYGLNFLISTLSQFTPENLLNTDHCKRWFEILYENMSENSPSVRDEAATALCHFCSKTKNFDADFKEPILGKFLCKLENPVDEMDCIVGILGVKNCVPYFVDCEEKTANIAAQIGGIFDVVKPEYSTWAIARSRCIEALTEISLELLAIHGSDASLISKITESILIGFDDYTSNSKGDTGFFVRQASVRAVSKLLFTVEKSRIDDPLREKSVCKLLKSVFDRNDILRINSFDVLKSIDFDHSSGFDHLSPEFYENLTDLLDDPIFGQFILHGMIWMIGSTTESVSKIAVDALLSYLNDIRENEIALQFFVASLINFCCKVEKETNNALNESISLIKTLDVVFSSNFLENYTKESDLCEILEFLRKQTAKTKNRQKLISGSQILCSMLQFSAEMPDFTRKCLKILLETFLVHYFPFVRKKTAENLYEALLNYGQLDNHTEWVLTVLTDTDWSNKEKNEELRENVEKLKDVLFS